MTFVDGDLYERSFETPAGTIDVVAEIVVTGRRIELRASRSTREARSG